MRGVGQGLWLQALVARPSKAEAEGAGWGNRESELSPPGGSSQEGAPRRLEGSQRLRPEQRKRHGGCQAGMGTCQYFPRPGLLPQFLCWAWQDQNLGRDSGCLCGAPEGSHLLSSLGLEEGKGQGELSCPALGHPAGGSLRAHLGIVPAPRQGGHGFISGAGQYSLRPELARPVACLVGIDSSS